MNVAYLVLKTAQNLYGKSPGALATDELRQVERLAARQLNLEARVLASIEARDVPVPAATLEAALAEVRGRYADAGAFLDDLAGNGLSLEAYRQSLERELRVDAVLEIVGSRAAQVSDIDVELYYRYHPEQFQRPETRVARHILITLNDSLPDNTRAAAEQRMQAIATRLDKDPGRFEEQALKHSECPTALHGGLLGEVRRGQLYPELDAALFAMTGPGISGPIESPVGLHLLRCDQISPASPLAFGQVRDKIREVLATRRKQTCQKAWLKRVTAAADATSRA